MEKIACFPLLWGKNDEIDICKSGPGHIHLCCSSSRINEVVQQGWYNLYIFHTKVYTRWIGTLAIMYSVECKLTPAICGDQMHDQM